MIRNKRLTVVTSILVVCALLFSTVLICIPKNCSSSVTKEYSNKLFDDTKVSNINIDMDDEDWNKMMENPLEEQYYKCNITINGDTINNVGIRPKGNTSLTQVASSDSERYSFKVKFDEYVNGQNYYGLDKLNLNNIYLDPTYMKEYIGYKLFECMGVVTPEVAYSNITVNDSSWGLYLAVEGLEESYLERNYGEDYGNLYKAEGTGTSLVYNGQDQSNYSGLKDNSVGDVTDEEFQKVVDMIYNLNEGNLEGFLNIKDTLKYFAVSSAIVNLDSYQSNLFHNYYIYEKDGECTILPWDLNLAFGGFSGGGHMPGGKDGNMPDGNMEEGINKGEMMTPPDNNSERVPQMQGNIENADKSRMQEGNMMSMPDNMQGNEMSASDSSSMLNYPIDEPTSTTMEGSPLLSQLLGNEEYLEIYHEYLNELVTKYFDSGYFKELVYNTSRLIDEYVKNDKSAFYTYDEFKSAVDELDKFGTYRAESISMQLSGELPSTKEEQEDIDLSTYFGENAVDMTALGGMGAKMGAFGKGGEAKEDKDNPMMDRENIDRQNPNDSPNTNNNIPPNNMGKDIGENKEHKLGNGPGNPMDMNKGGTGGTISIENIITVGSSMVIMIVSIFIVVKSKRRKFSS